MVITVKLKNKTNLLSFVDSYIIDYPTKTNLNRISIRSFGVMSSSSVSSSIYGSLNPSIQENVYFELHKERYKPVMDELKKIPSLNVDQVESNFNKIGNEIFFNTNALNPIRNSEFSKTVDLIPEESMKMAKESVITDFGAHLDNFAKKFVHCSDAYGRFFREFDNPDVVRHKTVMSKLTAHTSYNTEVIHMPDYKNILTDAAQRVIHNGNEPFLELLPEFMELSPNISFIGTELFLSLFLGGSVYAAYMYNLSNPINYNFFVSDLKNKVSEMKTNGVAAVVRTLPPEKMRARDILSYNATRRNLGPFLTYLLMERGPLGWIATSNMFVSEKMAIEAGSASPSPTQQSLVGRAANNVLSSFIYNFFNIKR